MEACRVTRADEETAGGLDGSVGPTAISPSFDDNKTYVVMVLTILFHKVSG